LSKTCAKMTVGTVWYAVDGTPKSVTVKVWPASYVLKCGRAALIVCALASTVEAIC
jgi:hypothetical protein